MTSVIPSFEEFQHAQQVLSDDAEARLASLPSSWSAEEVAIADQWAEEYTTALIAALDLEFGRGWDDGASTVLRAARVGAQVAQGGAR